MCLLWDWISETRLAAKGREREGGEREEEREREREAERCYFLDFVFPVDVTPCKLCAHTHFTKIKVVISLGALLLYIYHYHILIDHKDDISCLQLENSGEVFFFVFF